MTPHPAADAPPPDSAWGVLRVFLRLGLSSFGGPVAHLGYFRTEFVERRRWLDDGRYAELVALCQFLPGPASSQVGMALGLMRSGWAGLLAAWVGFTLPSALALVAFGLWLSQSEPVALAGALHGLKVVSVAVVAQAVWGMARSLCPDALRRAMALGAAGLALGLPLLLPVAAAQVLTMAACAALGWAVLRLPAAAAAPGRPAPVSRRAAAVALALFVLLLAGLPLLAALGPAAATLEAFYRAGALVFGGGHVVLPLLQAAVVPGGAVSASDFLAGYGAAQAVPGPLFTFAAFLGSVMRPEIAGFGGWVGGLLCLLAIFLPAALLVVAALPFWDTLRTRPSLQAALAGVNAGVVGLLLAALVGPVWGGAIHAAADGLLAAVTFWLLVGRRWSPLWVVGGAALAGWALGAA